MACDPHLIDLMRGALRGRAGLVEKRMFGGVCWMLHGNMLCCAGKERFLFRVGPDGEEAALTQPGAAPMEMNGRVMRGFVWVAVDNAIDAGLEEWVGLAWGFVAGMPAKGSKKVRGSTRV
mgnify:CR=1 FL=1